MCGIQQLISKIWRLFRGTPINYETTLSGKPVRPPEGDVETEINLIGRPDENKIIGGF